MGPGHACKADNRHRYNAESPSGLKPIMERMFLLGSHPRIVFYKDMLLFQLYKKAYIENQHAGIRSGKM